jgi:hypothetical protein
MNKKSNNNHIHNHKVAVVKGFVETGEEMIGAKWAIRWALAQESVTVLGEQVFSAVHVWLHVDIMQTPSASTAKVIVIM